VVSAKDFDRADFDEDSARVDNSTRLLAGLPASKAPQQA
jgi:hypothetical protein